MPCKSPMLPRRASIGLHVSNLKASFLAEPARGFLRRCAASGARDTERTYTNQYPIPPETRQKFARAGRNFRENIHGKDREPLQ
jgi:hypothetical protein